MSDTHNTVFDPKMHICKFGFKCTGFPEYNYAIMGDLYLKEIKFEFYGRTDEITDAIGFVLSHEDIVQLLPLLEMQQYERYRDNPFEQEWSRFEKGCTGYRDGWGYEFRCLSESGAPLFQTYMSWTFKDSCKPPYEKLLDHLRDKYKNGKELKKKSMLW